MRDAPPPLLSIVLVSFESRDDLERLLPTLYRDAVADLEIIVVDNRPGDGTAPWLRAHYPEVRLLTANGNPGYAGGNNLGVAAARGDFVLILNPDTELEGGALENLLQAARKHPDALITATLLQPDGSLNACGLQFHYTGITSCRHLGQRADAHTTLHPVPLLSGAAFIAAREVFTALGGFSESYFMYFEDVDLSLRAKLLGYSLLCAGNARVTHHYRLNMSSSKFYLLERNRLLTLLRLYQTRTFVQLAPGLLFTEGLSWAFALFKGPAYVWARIRGYAWLWQQRSRWQAERQMIQGSRTISDDHLLTDAKSELPLDQLMRNATLARFLSRLTARLYSSPLFAPRALQ